MKKNQIVELCKKFHVPEDLYESPLWGLRDKVGYSHIPYVLQRWDSSPAGDTVEIWGPSVDGQLYYEKWERGNASCSYYCTGAFRQPLPFTPETVEALLEQGFGWGEGVPLP